MSNDSEAYLQGFAGNEVTETPPVVEQEPEQAPAEAPEQPAPEFVQLTREDYERIRAAAERLPVLEQQIGKKIDTVFGKIGVIEQGQRQATAATLTDDDLAPFKDDLPELYAALSKVRAPANLDGVIEERVKPYAQRLDAMTEELRDAQQAAVEAAHPDWRDFTRSPEFSAWLATKDEAFRDKLNNTWSPSVLVPAIAEAKRFSKAKSPGSTRASVVAAAVQPRGTGATNPSGKSSYDYFLEGFNSA